MTNSQQPRSLTVRLPSAGGVGRVVVAVVTVAVFAVAVLAAFRVHQLTHDQNQDRSVERSRASAQTTAITYAIDFASYDYRHLDANFALTTSRAVNPFLNQYKAETAKLRAGFLAAKVHSVATVVSAGVVSATSNKAVVDLFLNQAITNSSSRSPRTDQQRVEMTLTGGLDKWKIADVAVV